MLLFGENCNFFVFFENASSYFMYLAQVDGFWSKAVDFLAIWVIYSDYMEKNSEKSGQKIA